MTHERRKAWLDADLAALRSALRAVPVPARLEPALAAAVRARARSAGAANAAALGARPAQRWQALAASLGVASVAALMAIAVGGLVHLGGRRDSASQAQISSVPSGRASVRDEFEPLMYGPGVSPSGTYSIVRVRIPLSSLALHAAGVDGAIEADVLVGEDGLASGIRFDAASTLLVSGGQ